MRNIVWLFALIILISAGCSLSHRGDLISPGDTETNTVNYSDDYIVADSSQLSEIKQALTSAESHYTDGVMYYQRNALDSSQISFEEALLILSEIDFDSEIFPYEAKWLETLLKEIESDYRLTLMTSGVLYSEGSAVAFRELFSDIKNFKQLKESRQFHLPSRDSIIYDMPIYLNEKVENCLAYYQTVAHESFERFLSRSTKFIPIMEKILEEEGVPHDLVYLPLIESGFNPHAYSYARAVGPWQFIYSTGKRYGLKRSWWYDERRDFEKSTRAAVRYLRDLYEEFNSWELALASYNGGEGRVRRLIKRQKTRDFWKLRLLKQTRNYVPLFIAATMIAKQPEKYGFAPSYKNALEWDTVEISKCMTFANISHHTGVPVSALEELNPELIRGVTPPDIKNYKLRLPKGYQDKFLASYEKIPSEKNTNWVQHKVRKGQTVSTIAKKYGVSMSSIISANSLKRPYRIYVGQNLMVPTTGGSWSYKSSSVVPSTSGSYKVRRGDTLWEIARAHGVSLTSLKRANGLTSNRIYPGRKLVIPGSKVSSSNSSSKSSVYIVRRGDSLYEIAKKHGVSIEALKSHNRLSSNVIYPNMKLKIPQSGSVLASSGSTKNVVTYKVKNGDSLWRISQMFNVTIRELMDWNDISNARYLKRGDILKIYAR